MEIVKVVGREILDSRGNPTVEADVRVADHTVGRAAVSLRCFHGQHEAAELRDSTSKCLPSEAMDTKNARIDRHVSNMKGLA